MAEIYGYITVTFKHTDIEDAWDFVDAVEDCAAEFGRSVVLRTVRKEVE